MKKKYSELPFSVAIKQFPILKSMLPLQIILEASADDDYIIRIDDTSIELGFKNDMWRIGDDDEKV